MHSFFALLKASVLTNVAGGPEKARALAVGRTARPDLEHHRHGLEPG